MTTFVMQARENYDPTTVATFAGTPASVTMADQQNIGCTFNPDERSIYYPAIVQSVGVPSGLYTNTTGFTLYDGFHIVAAAAGSLNIIDNNWINVAKKNIDTDAVVFNSVYDSTKTVPANVGSCQLWAQTPGSGYSSITVSLTGGGGSGMTAVGILDSGGSGALVDVQIKTWGTGYTSTPTPGVSGVGGSGAAVAIARTFATPSDGTYRRIMRDVSADGIVSTNGPSLVNPHTKDFFMLSQSCEMYQFRFSANYKLEISPYFYRTFSNPTSSAHVMPFGIDATWVYGFAEYQTGRNNNDFLLIPASITTDEVAADCKLAHVIYTTGTFTGDLAVRSTFGTDGNFYVFSSYDAGGIHHPTAYHLTKFAPPVLGSYGSNASGTMTDVTPWSGVGPDTTGSSYHNPGAPVASSLSFFRLPATNQAVGLIKFLGSEAIFSPSDALTQFGCVYMTFTSTPTYDYHAAFVTGYMKADWTLAASLADAAWVVKDFRETSNFLDMSDYVYSGIDYSKRWLIFQAYPVIAGVEQSDLQTVLVQYQFVSGSPPTVLHVYSDANWATTYAAYGTAISNSDVINASMMHGVSGSSNFTTPLLDPGFYDPVSNSLWFSGVTVANGIPTTLAANNMFHLNSAFTARAAFNSPSQVGFSAVDPPFLRLSFGGGGGGITQGHIF